MSFQENLRHYREKAGYKTAKDFAIVLNLPYTTYSAYEYKNREPKFKTLCKISKLLNVSIDILLSGEGDKIDIKDNEQIIEILSNTFSDFNYKHMHFYGIDKNTGDLNFTIGGDFFQVPIEKKQFIDIINKINDTANKIKKAAIFYEVSTKVFDIAMERLSDIVENNKQAIEEYRQDLQVLKDKKAIDKITEEINIATKNTQSIIDTQGAVNRWKNDLNKELQNINVPIKADKDK